MSEPLVSIIIPHYQTASLARLCLRSIRRYTTKTAYETIVVDNNSADGESLEYLRQVEWIKLIERTGGVASDPATSHIEALDMGVAASTAPYVLSFHTDMIPITDGWLAWLVGELTASADIAAVGTYKLEPPKPLKLIEQRLRRMLFPNSVATDHDRPFIRSHCALYRRAALEELGITFMKHSGRTTGRGVHFALVEAGLQAKLLDVREMLRRAVHLNHGTMALLPQLGARRKTIRRGTGRIRNFFARPEVADIYDDQSMDKS